MQQTRRDAPKRKDRSAPDASATTPNQPLHDMQSSLGNSATQARVQLKKDGDSTTDGSDTGPAPPSSDDTTATTQDTGPKDNPSTTKDVEKLADAGATTAPQLLKKIADLARSHPGWPYDCFKNTSVMTKVAGKLNGKQMYTALRYMDQPAKGSWRPSWWFKWVHQAQASGVSGQVWREIIAQGNQAERDAIIEDPTWIKLAAKCGSGALDVFPTRQSGLSTKAAASRIFVKWMAASASSKQIFKAVCGTGSSDLPKLAENLNRAAGGWNWVDDLDGPSLGADQRKALKAMIPKANPTGKAKLGAKADVAGPAGPAPAAKTLKATLTALKTANDGDRKKWTEAVQAAPKSQRVACAKDAALMTWAKTTFGSTLHPLHLLNVATAERAEFFSEKPFIDYVVDKTTWVEMVGLTSDRAYISKVAAVFNADDALCGRWLAKIPNKDEISPMSESDIRAMALLLSSATRKSAIGTKFGDKISNDAWATKNSAPLTAGVKDPPLTTLQTELDKGSPDQKKVVRLCGQLGATRSQLVSDATRMKHLSDKLSNNNLYHAVRALQIDFKKTIKILGTKTVGAAKYRELFTNAKPADRLKVARDNALVDLIKPQVPAPPMQLFCLTQRAEILLALKANSFQQWWFQVTPAAEILRVAASTTADATTFGPFFDQQSAWGWTRKLPQAPALLPEEKAAIARLKAATSDKSMQKAFDALLKDKKAKGYANKEASRVKTESKKGADPGSPVVAEIAKEMNKSSVDKSKIMGLCGRLTRNTDRQKVLTDYGGPMLGMFNAEETARFFALLKLNLADSVKHLSTVGAGVGIIQHVIARATPAHQRGLLDDAQAVTACARLGLTPFQAIPSLEANLATVQLKPGLWKWMDLERRILVMRLIAKTTAIKDVVAVIKGANLLRFFSGLPKAQGLTGPDREAIDTIFMQCADAAVEKKLFATRFALSLTGTWAQSERGDLKKLYQELKRLPIAHVSRHPKLTTMNRHHAGGGTYAEGSKQVNMGANTTDEFTGYKDGGSKKYTEKYFDHTVRHEIGHGVDALLGGKTSLVFNTYGWKEYGQGELDTWLTAMGAFTGPKANTMTDQDKKDIKAHLQMYLQSGGGTISGPSQPANKLAAAGSAWARFPQIRIVREMNKNTTGMLYKNRYTANGKSFSVNYYYRRFMLSNAAASASAPRDYAMFSPAEWFADMYAEFYRNFDGVDDKKLGGNCPGDVKTWFLQNVHTIGGRSPHQVKDGKSSVKPHSRVNH